MNTRWMIVIGFVIFIGTEAVARVVLFNKDLRKIAHRLRQSQSQFSTIKDNLVQIKDHLGEVADYVVKGDNSEINNNIK